MSRAPGFTLIELLITLAVIAILSAIAIPFAAAWVDKNRVSQASSQLTELYGRARAAALRNQSGLSQHHVSALACIAGAELSLHESKDSSGPDCADSPDWLTRLPHDIAISDSAGTITCFAFDSVGLLTESASEGCRSSNSVRVSRGSVNVSVFLN